jgi:HD-GYP domain-containing protein (c-di-GMP phosphodiesterase class II)
MRRITIKHAKPHMYLELPVYDAWGKLLAPRHKELTIELIRYMAQNGVNEIFIMDRRTDDIVIVPLFSPQTEVRMNQAFRQLLSNNTGKADISEDDLEHVITALNALIADMELNLFGEISGTCSISRKDYLYLKPVKTAGLSVAIGRELKMTNKELVALGLAAVLKDISLSPEIINDVDFLTEGGSPRLINHPADAAFTREEIAEVVLQHHENWSGSGYPQKLKGKTIARNAQIIAIADAFVDLLSERPGRNRHMPHEAIEYIMAEGGDRFDPQLVEVFVRHIPSYPAGLSVEMNNGDGGIVTNPKLGFVARPVVRILFKAKEGLVGRPYSIDLTRPEHQSMMIARALEYD